VPESARCGSCPHGESVEFGSEATRGNGVPQCVSARTRSISRGPYSARGVSRGGIVDGVLEQLLEWRQVADLDLVGEPGVAEDRGVPGEHAEQRLPVVGVDEDGATRSSSARYFW
jgi:hypothetical protein